MSATRTDTIEGKFEANNCYHAEQCAKQSTHENGLSFNYSLLQILLFALQLNRKVV